MKTDERVGVWVSKKLRRELKLKTVKLGYNSIYEMLENNLANLTIKK